MKGLKSQSGFTLIELVIVIVVLGILGAVAMIQFGNITQDAKDASLRGMAGAYGAQLAIGVNTVKALPSEGATVGACGASTRFVDCVYSLVPNATATGITRSAYDDTVAPDAFNICSDTDAVACGTANPATGCGSTAERFVRVTYNGTTGALTIAAPAFCAS
jgi:prepilin-type N-terminal cleavage/methylation domain-containing protein